MSTKEKIIVQSFWTKPMNDSLSLQLDLAALSLYYAHRSGYIVHMHTDSMGMQLLKDYGYDSLLPTLDEIPSDIPECIFAYGKILAMEREPIGSVHIDLDVFIKKPLLDRFFEDKTIDVVLQCEEISIQDDIYERLRTFFRGYGYPPELAVDHLLPANVGVIGFNNQQLKDEYIRRYKACAEYYKGASEIMMMDLFFEQVNVHYLIEHYGYRVWYILGQIGYHHMDGVCDFCDRIGYQHLQGGGKHTSEAKAIIRKYRETLCGY